MHYQDWLTIWIENTVRPTAKIRTYERYKGIIENHINPKLGRIELEKITLLIVQRFITYLLQSGNRITGKGLAVNTVNTIITVLQNSLKDAVVFGELEVYSIDKIKRPKTKEKEVLCFSVLEQRKIEESILQGKKDKMLGIILCLYTGLRIGELLSLTWEDIDFHKGIVSITKSCHYSKGESGRYERFIEEPKTPTSRREIPISKPFVLLLKEMKKRSICPYLIANGKKPISVRSYQRSFELLLQRLKISHKGFHALRHTFATRALECGMDVKTLSEILGHKDANITLNRYVHSLFEHKQEMMNRVAKSFERKSGVF